MNTQNILQNYGSRLDIVLDSSEYYDYDLGSNDLTQDDREYKDFTYEIEPLSGLTEFGSIQIDEFDNRVYDTGYTYSGLTFVFTFSGFTEHFDYSGHSYSNIYLNNDTYTYVGITGETHYFEIHDFLHFRASGVPYYTSCAKRAGPEFHPTLEPAYDLFIFN